MSIISHCVYIYISRVHSTLKSELKSINYKLSIKLNRKDLIRSHFCYHASHRINEKAKHWDIDIGLTISSLVYTYTHPICSFLLYKYIFVGICRWHVKLLLFLKTLSELWRKYSIERLKSISNYTHKLPNGSCDSNKLNIYYKYICIYRMCGVGSNCRNYIK